MNSKRIAIAALLLCLLAACGNKGPLVKSDPNPAKAAPATAPAPAEPASTEAGTPGQ